MIMLNHAYKVMSFYESIINNNIHISSILFELLAINCLLILAVIKSGGPRHV